MTQQDSPRHTSNPTGNLFRQRLDNGVFTLLFEVAAPEADCDIRVAIARREPLACSVMAECPLPSGLLFQERFPRLGCCDVVDFATRLSQSEGSRSVVVLSGRGRATPEVHASARRCAEAGLPNILFCTGDGDGSTKRRNVFQQLFSDSLDLLRNADGLPANVWPGCAVNPFMYRPPDLHAQYCKLAKKAAFGAQFVVAQAGWDMLKLQELRWFLDSRDLFLPVLTRQIIVTDERLASLAAGVEPGIRLSPDFIRMLEEERRHGPEQFMAAQWRRLQFMAAGAKLLGCSGLILSGIDSPKTAATAAAKIKEAFNEFTRPGDWRNSYFDYLARADMAPYPHRHYLYENLLRKGPPEPPKVSKTEISAPCLKDRLRFLLRRPIDASPIRVNSKEMDETSAFLKTEAALLRKCAAMAAAGCPKRLLNGACGGAKSDGDCEFGGAECVHSALFRIMASQGKAHLLEESHFTIRDNTPHSP